MAGILAQGTARPPVFGFSSILHLDFAIQMQFNQCNSGILPVLHVLHVFVLVNYIVVLSHDGLLLKG